MFREAFIKEPSEGPLTFPLGLVECELDGLDKLDEDGQDERVFCWAGRRVRCDGVMLRRGACMVRAGGGRVRSGVRARDAVASNRNTVA